MFKIAKKYYWLKLKEDFFRQKEIKKLRKIAGGDTYTIIYLKLQLLSLKKDGKLFWDGIEDTFAEEMALEIDEDEENVKITLAYLIRHKLVEEITEGEYILPETMQCIGSESAGAARVRKHREKKKLLQCNANETNCNTEIEIESEKELELEKELEISSSSKNEVKEEEEQVVSTDELKEVLRLCQSFNYKLKKIDAKGLIDAFTGKTVKKAIGIAANTEAFRNNQIKNYSSYLASILKDLSTEETKNINIQRENKKLRFADYTQKEYDYEKLEEDLMGWD